MPIPQRKIRPLTDHQIQEIASLLKDTDMSIRDISKTVECTPLSVHKVNKKYNVRPVENEDEGGGTVGDRQSTN